MINEKFEEHYLELYGARWEGLRKSLLEERPAFAFSQGLKTPYFMDYASVLAARSLRLPQATAHSTLPPDLQAEESIVLDACAAPGGKSLVIAASLPPGLLLLSNELST